MARLPPSVLHVSQPTTEGVARVVADLVAAQRARGWEVAVASPVDGWLHEEVAAHGARHFEWQARRSPGPSVPAEVRALGRIVAEVAPGVVHLFSAKAGLAGRLALRGRRPTLFSPEGWSFEVGGPVATLARLWERWGARWTDLLVSCSNDELQEGKEAGVRGDAEVVTNGVDLGVDRAAGDAERAQARSRLGLDDAPTAVSVGRLGRQKGQDLLLDAWPAVLAEVPDAVLVLVGDGPDRETLEQRAVERVRIVGYREDFADWMVASNLVVMPSRWEGMSLTLLAAMACARPVLAHDVEGMAEALTPPGRPAGGAVVPVGDTAALAAGIVARLADPPLAAREGDAARHLAEENHDLAAWADRICVLTEAVAARRPR
jgi:glycosyltransferase involved in cell wall biosynthesis